MDQAGFGAEQAPADLMLPPPEDVPSPDDIMGSDADPLRDYIGRKPRYSPEMAGAIMDKAEQWTRVVTGNGLMRQAQENFRAYHNADPDGNGYAQDSFSLSGSDGEMLKIRVNEMRSLIRLSLNSAQSQKAALQAKAANSEPASLSAAQLYDSVLDYYLSQWQRSRTEKQINKVNELCMITPAAHLLVEWDPLSGTNYVPEDGGGMKKRGDLYVKARSFWDMFFDTNLEDDDELGWVIVRDFVNRFDYAAAFPDMAEEILQLETKTELDKNYRWGWDNDTDMIPVYKFFHKSTPACPHGRVVHVLSRDLITVDNINPYTDDAGQAVIPLLTMRAAEGLGTLFGYAPANDLGPVQRAYNMVFSGVLTNEAAFGVGNVAVERGSDIAVNSLAGGLNMIEYAEGKQKPEAFSVTSNQKQSVEVINLLGRQNEKLSGANSVVRGDPDSSLKAASGRALGLIQAMFVESQSGVQRSRQQLVQDFGNLLLLIIKRFCDTPQIAAIAGKDRVAMAAEWDSTTFLSVARVVAEPVNPLSKTIAGNREEAEFLVSNGMVMDPLEYFTVRNTGQLEPIMRPEQSLKNLLHTENGDLIKGQPCPVLRTDKHRAHIDSHSILLDSPEIRRGANDPNSPAAIIMAHIMEHEQWEAEEQAKLAMQQAAAGQTQPPAGGEQSQTDKPKPGGGDGTKPPDRQQHEKKAVLPNGTTVPLPDTSNVQGAVQ
jgi:hypothetical protein